MNKESNVDKTKVHLSNVQAIERIESLVETMYHETTVGPFPDPEYQDEVYEALDMAIKALKQEHRWIPVSEKYEHHIDHTDCIWYGNDSGCPVTCSQYRDGWNDAMDYIFKNGDGYRPYRRNENG